MKPEPSKTGSTPFSCKHRRDKLGTLVKLVLAIVIVWGVSVLTVYLLDLPSQGGPDKFCESFYIPPDQPRNLTYPFSNTFNISLPIDWTDAGGVDALDKYR